MAILQTLAVNVVAQTEGLTRGLKKAQAEVKGFSAGTSSAVGLLGGVPGKLLAVGASLLGLNRLRAEFAEVAASIDATAKAADRLGLTVQAFRQLEHAGELAGVGTEQLTAGFTKLQKTIGEARQGSDTAAAALARIGQSADDLAAMRPEEAFAAIADGINALPNPIDRAAAAMDIFGQAGAEMLPLLAAGSAGLADMAAEADDLRGILTRADATAIEDMNDQISRMKEAWTGVAERLLVAVAPAVEALAFSITEIGVVLRNVLEDLGLGGGPGDLAAAVPQVDLDALVEQQAMLKQQADEAAKAYEDLVARGKAVTDELATPVENLGQKWLELEQLVTQGVISTETYRRGLAAIREEAAGIAAEQLKITAPPRVQVGAARRGTAAGFSAVQSGIDAATRQLRAQEQQLAQQKKTNQILEQIRNKPASGPTFQPAGIN